MQQLIYFIRKYRYFLFFLFLEIIALTLVFNNHQFHRSKFVSSANSITGGFYNKSNSISDYFQLTRENEALIDENNELINKIERYMRALDSISEFKVIDTTDFYQQYT